MTLGYGTDAWLSSEACASVLVPLLLPGAPRLQRARLELSYSSLPSGPKHR